MKIIYKKQDVLNNLTREDKELLILNSNAFWSNYFRNRTTKHAYVDTLSDFIFDNTQKRFYFKRLTADALTHALNL